MTRAGRALAAVCVLAVGVVNVRGGDWPQFMGPDSTNVVTDFWGLPRQWPPDGPKRLWTAAVGEGFGQPPGKAWEGQCFATMRAMGFDHVFDTQFGADLTIMEEGAEFVHKLKTNAPLPNITSCCPTWVKYAEQFHPDLLPLLSSAKSPMSMQGAIAKSFYAEKLGVDPQSIFSVAVMCCT